MFIRISMDAERFRAALDRLRKASAGALRGGLEEIAVEQTNVVRDRLPSAHRRLARSVIPQVLGPARAPVAHIGSPLPQARITHFGGTIRTLEARGLTPTPEQAARRVFGNKPIKYLTIPLTHAPFNTPPYARARDYKNTFVLKSPRTGKLYIAQNAHTERSKKGRATTRFQGRNSEKAQKGTPAQRQAGLRLLFRLVDHVDVKAFPYLYWSPADSDRASRILSRHLARTLKP